MIRAERRRRVTRSIAALAFALCVFAPATRPAAQIGTYRRVDAAALEAIASVRDTIRLGARVCARFTGADVAAGCEATSPDAGRTFVIRPCVVDRDLDDDQLEHAACESGRRAVIVVRTDTREAWTLPNLDGVDATGRFLFHGTLGTYVAAFHGAPTFVGRCRQPAFVDGADEVRCVDPSGARLTVSLSSGAPIVTRTDPVPPDAARDDAPAARLLATRRARLRVVATPRGSGHLANVRSLVEAARQGAVVARDRCRSLTRLDDRDGCAATMLGDAYVRLVACAHAGDPARSAAEGPAAGVRGRSTSTSRPAASSSPRLRPTPPPTDACCSRSTLRGPISWT